MTPAKLRDIPLDAVQAQLERIVGSSFFSNSKRYPTLLRYVVEKKLRGEEGDLKERTVGIEVFGREPDYDTNADPVVRVTAGEVRKRIAQYYQGHEDAIRIDLPSGSYVPEFRAVAVEESVSAVAEAVRQRRFPAVAAIILVLVVGAVAIAFSVRPRAPANPLDEFWRPVLNAPGSALLCVGKMPGQAVVAGVPPALAGAPFVALPDAMTLARIAGVLQAHNKRYSIQSEASTTFSELRNGPVILIGAFNNEWTMRLTGQLRFNFKVDAAAQSLWIDDRKNPGRRQWTVDLKGSTVDRDYAIITRVRDLTTDRIVTVAAGVLGYGTMAAGEFLSSPEYLEGMARNAPPGWAARNLQVVLSTQVIGGSSGPPRVVATYFW
jgi:hypothetical protein